MATIQRDSTPALTKVFPCVGHSSTKVARRVVPERKIPLFLRAALPLGLLPALESAGVDHGAPVIYNEFHFNQVALFHHKYHL